MSPHDRVCPLTGWNGPQGHGRYASSVTGGKRMFAQNSTKLIGWRDRKLQAKAAAEQLEQDSSQSLSLVPTDDRAEACACAVRPKTAPLPPSVASNSTKMPQPDGLTSPYQWAPVQTAYGAHKYGTCVRTVAMEVQNSTFEGATSHLIRLEPKNFKSRGSLWCYLLGGSFVICKGFVLGKCPKEHDLSTGRNMRIARLPVGLRPLKPLQFAALSRESYASGGHVTHTATLVTIVVTTEGWICGISNREVEGSIDLSAVRFCIGKGISLMDEVSLHTCDVAGTRMVTFQGYLGNRLFMDQKKQPLAILPESCRPPESIPFICAGMAPGGYHLLNVYPTFGFGCGGNLYWCDSIWNHDKINLTGIMYETAASAVQHSVEIMSYSEETQRILLRDFQQFMIRRFGSIEKAWDLVFDLDHSGEINFTEFGLGCKACGFVGNATKLWAVLDNDKSGAIDLSELMVNCEEPGSLGSPQSPQPQSPQSIENVPEATPR
eukprot:gnl/TRDRNA2_/TRDRNA2_161822_c0_seq4.p1 gnl/TRDRNA2_/TRDRNA2_161822_c0~~gnl/TRDRNA2_/TRDRNA2_161822_c0_seq4.p1  ORF type:complete len:514 (-),score=70.31 gnl/TRDRNA2_/TRDRNA2_161822_c0_seq4:216-1688(-)